MADRMWAAPLGHSIPSHRALGFCSHCKGRTVAEELAAWQVREQEHHETSGDQDDGLPLPLVGDVTTRTYDCPACDTSDAVLDATFLVTTKAAVHQVGRFAFCFSCETPQETARV
ncbi:hypothetical protein [Streptomyces sp. enrichment culture]|uniref:hypothetical protein n=1 Tax=Streptomyces sp. enrichment culture TaxID=1795815 RepID=UPI003F560754